MPRFRTGAYSNNSKNQQLHQIIVGELADLLCQVMGG